MTDILKASSAKTITKLYSNIRKRIRLIVFELTNNKNRMDISRSLQQDFNFNWISMSNHYNNNNDNNSYNNNNNKKICINEVE